ncbi:MAG: secondary thiamine-phosphate synthase enzyme YjbQ [Oscillospiraceae bacterium]
MIYEFAVKTEKQNFYNITPQIVSAIEKSGVTDGLCVVYTTHTTAGITINENADPDVVTDMLGAIDALFPQSAAYRHAEGNTAAHLKSSFVGCSVSLILSDSHPLLGIWQGVYFCEFDGPRNRRFYVKILKG